MAKDRSGYVFGREGSRLQWMDREAMVRRGARMWYAHATNRLEAEHFDVWFDRNLPRYAAMSWQPSGKTSNRDRIADAFWRDCEKRVITVWYGWSLETFG